MAERDWEEREGDEFGGELPSHPFELDLNRLFGNANPEDMARGAEDESRAPRKLFEKEVHIVGVYEQRAHDGTVAYFVMVRDNRDRNLRIYIGQHEAYSISMAMEGRPVSRPLTHDLLKIVVERLGWHVDRIIIDDEYNGIYYAKLGLVSPSNGQAQEVDCRPSDALAIAVRSASPIYVAEAVLEAEGRTEQEL
ncbi:MAG TPA: bifunctional nuclease family protein [Armatimonadota bacterium]|jgi:hypothetical protein